MAKEVVTHRERTARIIFPPSANEARLERLVETLQGQNLEVGVATESFKVRRALSATGKPVNDINLPAGSYIVSLAQPLRALAETILAFDIRLPTKFLEIERKEILEKNDTKLYETTAWSLPLRVRRRLLLRGESSRGGYRESLNEKSGESSTILPRSSATSSI